MRSLLCALEKAGALFHLYDVDLACSLSRSAGGLVVLPGLLLAVRLLRFYRGAKCGVNVVLQYVPTKNTFQEQR